MRISCIELDLEIATKFRAILVSTHPPASCCLQFFEMFTAVKFPLATQTLTTLAGPPKPEVCHETQIYLNAPNHKFVKAS